jgi:hypothetical protein
LEGDGPPAGGARDEIVWEDPPPGPPRPLAPRVTRRPQDLERRRRRSRGVVAALAVAAGVGGALAGCHPTGTAGLDPIYTGLLAALTTLAAARASRSSVLILATIATVLSRGWLLVPGCVALVLAFGAVFARRAHQRLNALTAALAIQVVLRWPSFGFHGATAVLAAIAVAPVLWTGWSRQRPRWRRFTLLGAGAILGLAVALSLPVAVGAWLARTPANRGITATHQALAALNAGDAPTAAVDLRSATDDLGVVQTRTATWWTDGGLLVPVVAQQHRAAVNATVAARALTAAAAHEADHLGLGNVAYRRGQIDLGAVRALGAPLDCPRRGSSRRTAEAGPRRIRLAGGSSRRPARPAVHGVGAGSQ